MTRSMTRVASGVRIVWGASRSGASRLGGLSVARDISAGFGRLAVGTGIAFDRALSLESFVNNSTGVLQALYPATWLGVSIYSLSEVSQGNGVDIPLRFQGKPGSTPIRVLHRSQEAMDLNFIRSGYGAPCVMPIRTPRGPRHPDMVHVQYAPAPIVGLIGTSHTTRATRYGDVPAFIVSYHDQRAIDTVLGGAHESSLAYTFRPAWAEEGAFIESEDPAGGGVRREEYDMEHILSGGAGRINHMLVGLGRGQSRGEDRARLMLDCKGVDRTPGVLQAGGPSEPTMSGVTVGGAGYKRGVPSLSLPANITAESLGFAADLKTIELADETPVETVDLITKLVAALGASAAAVEQTAVELGGAEQKLADQGAAMEVMAADLARLETGERATVLHRIAAMNIKLAGDVGTMSPQQLREAAVLARRGAAAKDRLDKLTGAARAAYTQGAFDSMVAERTPSTARGDGAGGAGAAEAGATGTDPTARDATRAATFPAYGRTLLGRNPQQTEQK